jgi:hypothetical protein
MCNDSVYSFFQYSCHFKFAYLVLLIIYHQEATGQVADSISSPKRSVLKTEMPAKQLQESPQSFLYLPFKDTILYEINYIDPPSIGQLLETHPWMHDIILKEYIRMHLVKDKERNGMVQLLIFYIHSISNLEREARLNMNRYGVPYDPLRPALLRTSFGPALLTSFDLEQFVQWLINLAQ